MRKSKKLLALLMGTTMLAASLFGGCSGTGYPKASEEGAPNYENSTEKVRIWGMSQVRDTWVMLNNEKYYHFDNGESFQTFEKTQNLKETGFNTVFIDWTFQDGNFKEGFEGTNFEKVVRDCETLGLETIWNGKEFASFASREESLINPEKWEEILATQTPEYVREVTQEYTEKYLDEIKEAIKAEHPSMNDSEVETKAQEKLQEKINAQVEEGAELYALNHGSPLYFKDQDQINSYFAFLLRDVKNYPSFAGVFLRDEPNYKMFTAIRETIIGLQSVIPDMYCGVNLLPLSTSPGIHVSYCENGRELGMVEAYKGYLENYKTYLGDLLDYVMYDDYPICNDGILSTYMQCQQMVADFARENNLERGIIMQTYDVGNRRVPEYEDMLFQMNVAAAFGCTEYCVYQYMPAANSNGTDFPNENNYATKWDGSPNPLWYGVRDTFHELAYNSKYITNFDYKGVNIKRTEQTAATGWGYTMGLKNDEFSKLSSYDFVMLKDMGGLLLISELYDEKNDQWAYYVVNATDSGISSEMSVTLTFNDYENVQMVQSMNTFNAGLKEHTITFELGSGRAAIVMPY